MKAKVNKITIEVLLADLFTLPVDAVVLVSDTNLSMEPETLQRVGPEVQERLKQIGWADVGTAVITDAGRLANTLKILHAVGPRWGEGAERGKLSNLVWECLRIMENSQLKSIAFPPISIGTLGYPIESCANIMLTRIIDYTFEEPRFLRDISVCLRDDNELAVFEAEFDKQLRDLRQSGEGKVRA